MWIDDSTAFDAPYVDPSAVTTPVARPPSTTIRVTGFEVRMLPPFSSMIRARASGRRIDPPSGRIQLKR